MGPVRMGLAEGGEAAEANGRVRRLEPCKYTECERVASCQPIDLVSQASISSLGQSHAPGIVTLDIPQGLDFYACGTRLWVDAGLEFRLTLFACVFPATACAMLPAQGFARDYPERVLGRELRGAAPAELSASQELQPAGGGRLPSSGEPPGFCAIAFASMTDRANLAIHEMAEVELGVGVSCAAEVRACLMPGS